MTAHRASLSIPLILTLVALRVGIGTHFFREGLNKFRDPKPFSAAFFGNAKGPFAGFYQKHIWDWEGQARLRQEDTVKAWDAFRARAISHFQFDEGQTKRADAAFQRASEQLEEHFTVYRDDIHEYLQNLARRDRYRTERQRLETPSLRAQLDTIEGELRSKRGKLLAPLDLMWQGYAREINSLATPEQWRQGPLTLDKPGRHPLDSESIDRFIPWFDATLGVLLIVGLLTRPAALAATAFLISVICSQWPLTPDTAPTWSQFVEALGLLVVAAAGAGRYAGLDGILARLFGRRSAAA